MGESDRLTAKDLQGGVKLLNIHAADEYSNFRISLLFLSFKMGSLLGEMLAVRIDFVI